MEPMLQKLGQLAGVVGILVCVIAVIARLLGKFFLAGVGAGTLLQAGTTAVVIGCFLLLMGRERS